MSARKDPEGRRRAIVEAAVQEMVEHGPAALTHRRVAERAQVPLGATTYYFATLDDLRVAALEAIAAQTEEDLEEIAAAVAACGGAPEGIAEQLCLYLADRDRVLGENALYFAGVHEPDLRPLSRRWVHSMAEILSAHTSPRAARATAVYMDGAILYALLNDTPLDQEELGAAITALMGIDSKDTT
ncbi:TetR/AcrR family transcriptional regulator [Nocardiopsis synnemataformans]|uniref:TetR/AcrR family transcriptional regulator n=1 Tax=Nocardiopsis synnemataformans TaxID=61305 RepID=UPI003EB92C9D